VRSLVVTALFGLLTALGAPSVGASGSSAWAIAPAAPAPFHSQPLTPMTAASGVVQSLTGDLGLSSDIWSGYDLNGGAGAFSAISGCWIVPAVSPTATPTYSGAWIGIDGGVVTGTSPDLYLIQTGTLQAWVDGTAEYDAWWEILTPSSPAPATTITTMPIEPGDAMCAAITEGAGGQWTISLSDETTGSQFSTLQPFAGPGESAEWIVERPVVDGSTSTLADYGEMTFNPTSVDGVNPGLIPSEGMYMLDGSGNVASMPSNPDSARNGFSVAYYPSAQPAPPPSQSAGPAGGYTVDVYGGLHPYGDAPYEAVSAYYPGWNIIRGVVLDACDPSGHSGWTVDGYGGMHQFGAAPFVTVYGGYYPGWDVIRGVVAWCDQGQAVGYTVDAYGGMHPFSSDPGGVEPPYPQVTGYWPGQYLTAGIVLIPGTDEGYVVDAYGGLHPFNGAPYYNVSAYYPGFNIVRGVTLLPGGGGGYTVDAYGGLHPFGSAGYEPVSGYYAGWDIITGVAASSVTGGYTVDAYGGLHPYGTAPYLNVTGYYPGQDIIEGVVFTPT
jgi:hypothetical protein